MPANARAAIRRLRTGVVPESQIERLSVGYGKAKQTVGDAYEGLMAGDRPSALFVKGEWGTGKTHFLSFVRGAASSRGIAVSKVDLNARSAALNFPQRFYGTLVENLRAEGRYGLRAILEAALGDPSKRAKIREFTHSPLAADLSSALAALCIRYERSEELGAEHDAAWALLAGVDLAWADYTYKREQAVARLGSIGRLLAMIGYDGAVVTFDEAETIDQLWNVRSRLSAYGVLGKLCRLDAIWCVFGITERFERAIAEDMKRGVLDYPYISSSAAWFLRGWRMGNFTVLVPPEVDGRNAKTLAGNVLGLYMTAYASEAPPAGLIAKCVEDWVGNPSRNPRRLIRNVIHHLDLHRSLTAG